MLDLEIGLEQDAITEDTRILEAIADKEVKDFTLLMLNQYGEQDELDFANRAGDVLLMLLRKKNMIAEGLPQQKFVDVLLSAALMHNVFYQEDDLTSLFEFRQACYNNELVTLRTDLLEAIIQSVEGHLGENTPVPMCKPANNTPSEMLADAVWIAKNFTPQA